MPTFLSPHFTLEEMIHTQVRTIPNKPMLEHVENLRRLCTEGLEPIRAKFGPLYISSGFRCQPLNAFIGGSPTSRHVMGLAADFLPLRTSLKEVMEWVIASSIDYDQIIYEFGRWLHLGLAPKGQKPRKQALMIFKSSQYLAWNSNDLPEGKFYV